MVILVGIRVFYLIKIIIIFEKHDCVGGSEMFWSKTKIIVKLKKNRSRQKIQKG